MDGRIGRGAGIAAVLAAALLTVGCGRVPGSVSLAASAEPEPVLPQVCLGAGLDLALGYGAYAVPLAGVAADADELPSWEAAALQMTPPRPASQATGPVTLCAYVADHPSPFSTRGGDDTIVCVLVDESGSASLLGVRMVAAGGDATACAPTGAD